MKTARMTILVTPDQKAEIEARAQAHGLSAGELLRRAAMNYQVSEDEAVLNALADQLESSVKEARAAMKSALSEVRATLGELGKHRKEAA